MSFAAGLGSVGAVEIGETEVDLSIADGRLSLALTEPVPLRDLLEAIGAEAGFEVEVSGDLGEVQPPDMERRPLDQAIRALAGDRSLLMIYSRGVGQMADDRLSRIVIYPARSPAERARARAQATRSRSAPASGSSGPLSDDVAERIRELDAQGVSPGEISQRVRTPVDRVQRYLQTIERQN